MISVLQQYFTEWLAIFSYIFMPSKRVYWLYLLSSVLLVLWLYKQKNTKPVAAFVKANSLKYWLSRSSQVDMKWILFNQVFAIVLFVPVLGGQISWAMSVYRQLVAWFGGGDFIHWPTPYVMALFSITLFLLEDFSRFLLHYAYHKIPLLWRFHAIHHSAKLMTPLTLYRVHIVEYFINSLRAVSVIGLTSGVFIYCFDGTIGVYEVLGISIFNFVFNLIGANLRHSHIWISFGKLETLFISPAQHQIHHSNAKVHLDKNFGASLAIWDRLFSSWLASKNEKVTNFGLFKQGNTEKFSKQLLGIRFK